MIFGPSGNLLLDIFWILSGYLTFQDALSRTQLALLWERSAWSRSCLTWHWKHRGTTEQPQSIRPATILNDRQTASRLVGCLSWLWSPKKQGAHPQKQDNPHQLFLSFLKPHGLFSHAPGPMQNLPWKPSFRPVQSAQDLARTFLKPKLQNLPGVS